MPKGSNIAVLKGAQLTGSKVNRADGIVEGCQLAQAGKLATFRGVDGKPKSILITPKVVDGLLALFSENERATAHWTHSWIETGADGIASTVATFRNFRKAENGDLLADAFLWPTEHKEAILHAAENDPKGMMISTVFDYTGGESDAVPTRVFAADFVEVGASTTALCAKLSANNQQSNEKNNMDPDEIKKMIDEAIAKALEGYAKKDADQDVALSDEDVAKMESEAGVTDADKKDDDKDKPAVMRAILSISRANKRILASAKEETAVLAEASFVKKIGTGKLVITQPAAEKNDAEDYITKQIAGGATRAKAILRMASDAPKIYNAAREAGKL